MAKPVLVDDNGQVQPGQPDPDPWSQDDLNAAQAYFQSLVGGHPDWGNASDAIPFYQQKRQAGLSHDAALADVANYLGWNKPAPAPASQPAPSAPSAPSAPQVPFSAVGAAPTTTQQTFLEPWTPPTPQPLPQAPTFVAPKYTPPPAFTYEDFQKPADFTYDKFTAPDANAVFADPGYQFRRDEANRAFMNNRAAQGTANTGGTIKDFLNYNQNAASQEYNNVWNRDYGAYQTNFSNALNAYTTNFNNALGTYATNRNNAVDAYNSRYQTQYIDPWNIANTSALETFQPTFTAWQTNAANVQHQNDIANTNSWNDIRRRWGVNQDIFNNQFQVATA